MEKFANLISSRRWWFVSFIIILTAFFVYSAKGIKTDNSIEIWLKQDDPALAFYNKFKKDFGNEEFLLIAINNDNIFSAEGIRVISRISTEIKKLKGISDVTSIPTIFKQKINTPYFKELLNKSLKLEDGIRKPPKVNPLEIFRHDLLKDPIYINNVISRDGKTTAIIAMVEGPAAGNRGDKKSEIEQNWSEFRKELIADVRKIIIENSASNVYLAGPSVINAELDRMSQEDLAMFVPLMFCVAIAVLIVLFRKVSGVILPMASVGISNIWTIGLYAACGNSMNMVSGIITPVIFVVTLSTSVHIINHYYYLESAINNCQSSTANLQSTIKHVGMPCFLSCLTTSIGFLSLMTSDVLPVKMTGAFTAAGIMLSFFVSVVLITAASSFLRYKRSGQKQSGRLQHTAQIFQRLLGSISSFVCYRTWFVMIFCIVLIVISIYGILRLEVESDIIKAFPKDSEIIIANNYIEDNLTGLLPLEIAASPSNNTTVTDPMILNSLENFQEFLKSINEVTFTLSIADVIKKANQTINTGNPQYYKIPESEEKANACLNMASLYEGSIVNNLFTPDKTSARISVRMKQAGSERYSKILDMIKDYIENNMTQNINMRITGVVHLLIEMQDYLLMNQIKTFSLAFAIIFIVMVFLLRSIKLALISMIPNIIPVILTIGAMGYADIRLDSGTMMIASVAIGIAVDDTIHFLYRFRKEFNQRVVSHDNPDINSNPDMDIRKYYVMSIDQTLRHVGKAMIFTSIVAVCGFLTLCLSHFKPIQYFGLLTAVTMASAIVADLFVTPCCLLVFRPRLYIALH